MLARLRGARIHSVPACIAHLPVRTSPRLRLQFAWCRARRQAQRLNGCNHSFQLVRQIPCSLKALIITKFIHYDCDALCKTAFAPSPSSCAAPIYLPHLKEQLGESCFLSIREERLQHYVRSYAQDH